MVEPKAIRSRSATIHRLHPDVAGGRQEPLFDKRDEFRGPHVEECGSAALRRIFPTVLRETWSSRQICLIDRPRT